jgi:hypothetical protein
MRARLASALVLVGIVAVSLAVGCAAPGAGADSFLAPVQDRYEPGDLVTLVGYARANDPAAADGDAPTFYAYLRAGGAGTDAAGWPHPVTSADGRYLAPLTVEPSSVGPQVWRVSVTFRLPTGLVPGRYQVVYCNDPCTGGLGDLVGGIVDVGADPTAPVVRAWPPDEPEIADLPPGAVVVPVTTTVTSVAAAPTPAAPAPTPVAVTVAVPPTTVAVVHDPARALTDPHPAASPVPLVTGVAVTMLCVAAVLAAMRPRPAPAFAVRS